MSRAPPDGRSAPAVDSVRLFALRSRSGRDALHLVQECGLFRLVPEDGAAGLANGHFNEPRVEDPVDRVVTLLARCAKAPSIAFGALIHGGDLYARAPNAL